MAQSKIVIALDARSRGRLRVPAVEPGQPAATPASRPRALLTIALVSCSMLMYEVLLTRICALRLFFHFGFLVISNCLLCIGASGTVITLFQDRFTRNEQRWTCLFA